MNQYDFSEDIVFDKLGITESVDKFALSLSESEKLEFQESLKNTKGLMGKELYNNAGAVFPEDQKKLRKEYLSANKKELSLLGYIFYWIFRLGFLFGKPSVVKRHEIKTMLRNQAASTQFYKNRYFTENLALKLDFINYNCLQIAQALNTNPFAKTEYAYAALKKGAEKKVTVGLTHYWQLFFITSYDSMREIKDAIDNLSEERLNTLIADLEAADFRDYMKRNLEKVQSLLQKNKTELENDYNLLKSFYKIFAYNYDKILKKFSSKYEVNKRKTISGFRKVNEEGLVNDLIQLYKYINQFDASVSTKDYIYLFDILLNFVKKDINPDINDKELNAFALNVITNVKELLENKHKLKIEKKTRTCDALTLCLKAATRNENFYVEPGYEYETFIKDFFEKFKYTVRTTINKIQVVIKDKEKKNKIKDIFGGSFHEINLAYNSENKSIIDSSNKLDASFNYVMDANLIQGYLKQKYPQYEQALIDVSNSNILLDTYIRGSENAEIPGIQKCLKRISDYINMVYSPFVKKCENRSRDSVNNMLGDFTASPNTYGKIGILEEVIIKLDIQARAVVEEFYRSFGILKSSLQVILEADKNAAVYKPDKNFYRSFETVLKKIKIIKNNISAVLETLNYEGK